MKLLDEQIFDWIERTGQVNSAMVLDKYVQLGRVIPEPTLRWKLAHWVKQGKLIRVGRGKYARITGVAPLSAWPDNPLLQNAGWFVKGRFNQIPVCIWDTKQLSGYTLHQPARTYGVMEVDRYGFESVLDLLSTNDHFGPFVFDDNQSAVFKGALSRSHSNERPIVLRKLLTEAPIESSHGLQVPTIEKLIVDLICDEDFFYIYQGRDLDSILEGFHARHPINYTKVAAYAAHRSRQEYVFEKLEPFKEPYEYYSTYGSSGYLR